MPVSSSDAQTTADWDLSTHHQIGLGVGVAKKLEPDDLGRYSHHASRWAWSHEDCYWTEYNNNHLHCWCVLLSLHILCCMPNVLVLSRDECWFTTLLFSHQWHITSLCLGTPRVIFCSILIISSRVTILISDHWFGSSLSLRQFCHF